MEDRNCIKSKMQHCQTYHHQQKESQYTRGKKKIIEEGMTGSIVAPIIRKQQADKEMVSDNEKLIKKQKTK